MDIHVILYAIIQYYFIYYVVQIVLVLVIGSSLSFSYGPFFFFCQKNCNHFNFDWPHLDVLLTALKL